MPENSSSNSAEPDPSESARSKIIKNGFANIARGGTGAFVTILLPPFLTKLLTQDAYGTWLLILQLSAYVNVLDFGIQTAVGRFVAHSNERQDARYRDSIISTALAILSGLSCLAIVGILGLAWQLPVLFRDMPQELHQEAQLALLLVGGSLAIGLPFTVFGGIFIGLQRYDIPAWILGLSKLIGGGLVILIAYATHSIAWMAVGIAITSIGASSTQLFASRKLDRNIRVEARLVSKKTGQELLTYCAGLSVWTLGMLLVSGLDTTIVGFFDYKSVVYYSIAISLTNFIVSLHTSLISVLLPAAAVMDARGDEKGLGELLVSSTRYGLLILLFTSIPLIVASKWLITVWIGSDYADHTTILLQVLVIANVVRLSGAPYAVIVAATGQQRLVILSPIVEGVSNLFLSLLMTSIIGALGAAIGTVLAGLAGIAFHFFYNLPRTKNIHINQRNFITYALVQPALCASPGMVLCFLTISSVKLNILIYVILIIWTIGASLVLLWHLGLRKNERRRIISYIHKFSEAISKGCK
jgi:O-antigen/teichoic acid export membrane protein